MEAKTSKIKISNFETKLCIPCLVCGERVEINCEGIRAKICEKCRKAILKMREDMENE